jgi:hemoglobin
MSTLLVRIGGEAAVTAVVDSFYDKVFTDPILLPFFANTDFVKQRARQTKFMIQFMDGKAPTANEYMRNAHRKYVADMGLNSTHFDIVVSHLVKTMTEFKVPPDLIAEAGSALESLRADVLGVSTRAAA